MREPGAESHEYGVPWGVPRRCRMTTRAMTPSDPCMTWWRSADSLAAKNGPGSGQDNSATPTSYSTTLVTVDPMLSAACDLTPCAVSREA